MLQSLYDKKYSESQSGWLAMTPSALGRGLWGLENVSVLARLQLPVALGFSDLTPKGCRGRGLTSLYKMTSANTNSPCD